MQIMDVTRPDTLVQEDEKREARERLESLLLEGMASEESEFTPADIEAIRSEALAQIRSHSTAR